MQGFMLADFKCRDEAMEFLGKELEKKQLNNYNFALFANFFVSNLKTLIYSIHNFILYIRQ